MVGKTARGVSGVAGKVATRMGEDTEFDMILDYLLEHDVCSLDEAEEVMMELTEEEIENILTEREMTAADKKKEGALKKKYDDSGMKASMKKQYGAEKGKKVYFATIRKQAMEEVEQVDENRRAARSAGGYKDDSKKQTDPSKPGFTGISNSIKDIMRQNREIEARKKKGIAEDSAPVPNITPVEKPKDRRKPPADTPVRDSGFGPEKGTSDRALVPPGSIGDLTKPKPRPTTFINRRGRTVTRNNNSGGQMPELPTF